MKFWADIEDLPGDFVPSTRYALDRYLAGEPTEMTVEGWDGPA
ncbi:hypothetical protein [Streptodolium elevatio]|uniref:Uncharacterized protein n=1 Tax=Streptodolium elevatio TaxID=3157996 RepID=A0ABV3DN34_9ACTN